MSNGLSSKSYDYFHESRYSDCQEHFRDLLEENALRLTDRSHMTKIVPFIHDEEISRIKQEIDGKFISVIPQD